MIDWNKPIELMDGTPLVLSPGKRIQFGLTNPDRDGDYWVTRVDGETIGPAEWLDMCCCPKSGEGSDGILTVRNRA